MKDLAETGGLIGEVAVTAERGLYPENGNGNGNGKRIRRACAITAALVLYVAVQWITSDRIFQELRGFRTDLSANTAEMNGVKAEVANLRANVNEFHAKYDRDVDAGNRIHRDLWRAIGRQDQYEQMP